MKLKPLASVLYLTTFILLSACRGCSRSNKNAIQDSVQNAREDSLKKEKVDSIAAAKSIDTLKSLGILKLDTASLTCDSLLKMVSNFGTVSPEDYLYLIAQLNRCNAAAFNNQHPDSPQGVIMYEDPKDNKILFNTISLKTGEDIAKASKLIITLAAAIKTGDPEATEVANVVGGFTVDAYLDAAKRNDPLIIIMPAAVPGAKLAKDGLKLSEKAYVTATKLHLDIPITVQVNAVKTVFSLSQKAADIASQKGIPTVKVGPIRIPAAPPIVGPIPGPIRKVVKKICPFCPI